METSAPIKLTKRVAFIDDDLDLLESYLDVLKDRFEISVFQSGSEFLKSIDQDLNKFDLILTDFNMPRMNGLELLKKFSELGGRTPSVVFSGYLNKDTCLQLNRFGALRLLEKPAQLPELLEAMEQTLKINQRLVKIRKLKQALTRMEDAFRAGLVLTESVIDDKHHLNHSFQHLESIVKELIQDVESLELDEGSVGILQTLEKAS